MTAPDIALLGIELAGLLTLARGLFGNRWIAFPVGAVLVSIPLAIWYL